MFYLGHLSPQEKKNNQRDTCIQPKCNKNVFIQPKMYYFTKQSTALTLNHTAYIKHKRQMQIQKMQVGK